MSDVATRIAAEVVELVKARDDRIVAELEKLPDERLQDEIGVEHRVIRLEKAIKVIRNTK